ncbi:MAG: hypothetical protein IKY34_00295 [Ruminiclostridium sp.]|nr:hypothetical protein [Ruminiclostridium sp.]
MNLAEFPQGEFISTEDEKSSPGSPYGGSAEWDSLDDAAVYLGRDAFFNLK